jgi:A/G-specific adenine glycosylase
MYAPRVAMSASQRHAVLGDALLGWYALNRRDLAFRRTRDPYAVLVAEVMLQQTQAARVEPAWEAFLARFPNVAVLAAATPADVIRAWAGLGYYGRAVRLHRAARAIVERHHGRVPDELGDLQSLPGVGAYTARAVAATAFGQPVAAVDTNVARVVSRVFGLANRAGSRPSPAAIQRVADAWIPAMRAAEWTHATMDLGATVCRKRDPQCPVCPLRRLCTSADTARRRDVAATRAGGARERPRTTRTRFEATRRWLRGRIVATLSASPRDGWVALAGPIGLHSGEAVRSALAQLQADGVVELDAAGAARLARTAAPT